MFWRKSGGDSRVGITVLCAIRVRWSRESTGSWLVVEIGRLLVRI